MTTLTMPNSKASPLVTGVTGTLAGRGARLGAALLDLLIFSSCLIPGIAVMSISDSDIGKGFGGALLVIGWLGILVTQMVLLVKRGQSLGKIVLGIKIVKVSDEGVPGFVKVVLLRIFVPSLLAGIPYAGALIWLADALFIFRDDRRCLHDLIAETKVIDVSVQALGSPTASEPAMPRDNFTNAVPPENHIPIPLQPVADEEFVYAEIAKELETGVADKGLWTRLFAECGGDEKQMKVIYIKQRVERLIASERVRLELATSESVKTTAKAEIDRLISAYVSGSKPTINDVIRLSHASSTEPSISTLSDKVRGDTLLHWCARLGLEKETTILINNGADTNAPNGNGRRPFELTEEFALRAAIRSAVDAQPIIPPDAAR
jgi:uncharacterized RDD family membrane protein YckC